MSSKKFASLVTSVTNRLHPRKPTFKSVVEEAVRARTRFSAAALPLPKILSDQIPQELFEQFIYYLGDDRRALSACSIVCRAWFAVSRYHLFAPLVVRPVFLHFGQGDIIQSSVALREFGEFQSTTSSDVSARHPNRWRKNSYLWNRRRALSRQP